MTRTALAVTVVASVVLVVSTADLEIMNELGVLKFDSPPGFPGRYVPERTVPTSLEVGRHRLFIAVPRLFSGVPATLAWIPRNGPGRPVQIDPSLHAYPSWEWHAAAASGDVRGNCSGIISVFRMRLDRCSRLWVLDNGVLDSLEGFKVVCNPKILIFDLATDSLVKRIDIPEEVVRRNSVLTNLVLDEEGERLCGRGGTVYMSDTASPGLIVYDIGAERIWRVTHPFMYPEPDRGTFTLGEDSFTLMDGILGMAVTPAAISPQRLFFQPFASNRIFSVETRALLRGPNPGDDAELPVVVEGEKSSQAAGMVFDPRDNSLYFSPVSETAVAAWVPGTPSPRVVAFNPDLLQYVLDFRSAQLDSRRVWLISTRLHKFFKQAVDPSQPHIRIMRIADYSHRSFENNTVYY